MAPRRLVLGLDPEREHLTVLQSACSLYLDEHRRSPILRYEYLREPLASYPGAHLQVHGTSEAMGELCRKAGLRRELHRFHFPVGGRRYRPSVEDVIEFLVVEGLVDAHHGWRDAVKGERDEFHQIQLRAAVRRAPEPAAEQLTAMGWTVQPPREE